MFLLFVGAAVVGVLLIGWLLRNPVALVIGLLAVAGILAMRSATRRREKKATDAYKQSLDSAFVTAESPPSTAVMATLKSQQQGVPTNAASKRLVSRIESDVYQAVLDKILDDGVIADDEAATITAAEQVLSIDPDTRLQTKKEIFSAAYVEAIQDREITQEEHDKLDNLLTGLAIPRSEVQRELDIMQEIIDAQALKSPPEPIARESLSSPIQKSEEAYYQCPAQVLSKRKSNDSITGYEYTVRRDGTLILTNKRVLVVNGGTTAIRFSDVADVEVDIDDGVVEISKTGSGRATVLKTESPIYAGRLIDLLVHAKVDGGAALE